MTASGNKLPPIDRRTRYLPLREAACLIGRRYSDWNDDDIDRLAESRETTPDQEAWDRAAHAEQQLKAWILGRVVEAYDQNEYGLHQPLDPKWLAQPYFEISIRESCFLWYPEEWAPLFVDRSQVETKLTGVKRIEPRKTKYSWDGIIHQAWKIALDTDPKERTSANLVRRVDQWFINNEGNGESRLGEKELKQIASEVLRYLGDRSLEGEISPAAKSPDDERDQS